MGLRTIEMYWASTSTISSTISASWIVIQARLLLIARTERHRGIGSCSFYVVDADALHEELVTKGAHVQGPPISHPWGLREFRVLDPEGNRLSFAQPFE